MIVIKYLKNCIDETREAFKKSFFWDGVLSTKKSVEKFQSLNFFIEDFPYVFFSRLTEVSKPQVGDHWLNSLK